MSTAMIGLAPARRRARDGGVADPAAAEHRHAVAASDVAGVHGGAEPGHHAAARAGRRSRVWHRGSTLVAWPAATSVCSANAPMPSAGVSCGAVGERHLLRGVEGGEAVPRTATPTGAAGAADRAPVEDDEVAGRDLGDVGADRLDDPRGLVPEEERELVVDRALAVVEVGVAHAARLHRDPDLARARVGDDDLADLDRRALGERDHTSDRDCCHAACLPQLSAMRCGPRRVVRSVEMACAA